MTNSANQSGVKSRERLKQKPSRLIDSLDLAASGDKINRYTNILNMPPAWPQKKLAALYKPAILDITKKLPVAELVSKYPSLELIKIHEGGVNITSKIALRVWIADEHNNIRSRVLIVIMEDAFSTNQDDSASSGFGDVEYQKDKIIYAERMFGNVDLAIVPFSTNDKAKKYEFRHLQESELAELDSQVFESVARYLDNGQVLNLGRLSSLYVHLGNVNNRSKSRDVYQQYLDDFVRYNTIFPNGGIMRPDPENVKFLLHRTDYKSDILTSKELRTSRAGCLGSSVYTTSVISHAGKQLVGGHTIGLHKRKKMIALAKATEPKAVSFAESPSASNYILLEIHKRGNCLTNWMDKLGRGKILLEARNKQIDFYQPHMLSHHLSLQDNINQIKSEILKKPYSMVKLKRFKNKSKVLERVSALVVSYYEDLYPFLLYINHYARSKNHIHNNKTKVRQEFEKLYKILNKINFRFGEKGHKFSFINGINFEIVKDYLLLSSDDEYARIWRTIGSYNMQSQYASFFQQCQSLRDNWDTSDYSLNMNQIKWMLQQKKSVLIKDNAEIFEQFFLDRMSYYINLHCLEGVDRLPHPTEVTNFDFLAENLPALAGILQHYILESIAPHSGVRADYLLFTHKEYDSSYENRGISLPIKAGYAGTEEFGVTSRAKVSFFDVSFKKDVGNRFYSIDVGRRLDLSIRGVSAKNGFTRRSIESKSELSQSNYTAKLVNGMLTSMLDQNFDFSTVAQDILLRYYHPPYPEKPSKVTPVNSSDFTLTDYKINRVVHGAMHASRVAAYVKVLHHFRKDHNDAAAWELAQHASCFNLCESQLIVLTQLAGLFHDSGREAEGKDYWDEESSNNLLNYLAMMAPDLDKKLALALKYAIQYKDNESAFRNAIGVIDASNESTACFNYLRQLIADADCLDVMRIRKTFKMKYLCMSSLLFTQLRSNQEKMIDLVLQVRSLIAYQHDLYFPSKIEPSIDLSDASSYAKLLSVSLAPQFDLRVKEQYEFNQGIYQKIINDMNIFPALQSVHKPIFSDKQMHQLEVK